MERDTFKMSLLEKNFPLARLSSRDHLFELYVKQGMSLPDVSRVTGISSKTLYFVLKFFGIQMRTASQSNGSKMASAKRAATFKKKYGAENPLCAGTVPYMKRNNTVKQRYGVSNVWQLKDVQRKITEAHLAKYGCKRVVKIGSNRMNRFESRIASVLIDLAIPFQYSVYVAGRQFDFRICENILLECNGSFWHANPKKYAANDEIKWPGGIVRAGDIGNAIKKRPLLQERPDLR